MIVIGMSEQQLAERFKSIMEKLTTVNSFFFLSFLTWFRFLPFVPKPPAPSTKFNKNLPLMIFALPLSLSSFTLRRMP